MKNVKDYTLRRKRMAKEKKGKKTMSLENKEEQISVKCYI